MKTETAQVRAADEGRLEAPVRPLFAVAVARRKWEELQDAGHRMQRLYFEREDGSAGHIDAWGVVTWAMGIVMLAAGVGIAIGLSNLLGDGSMRPSHPIQQMVEESGGLGLACTYLLAAVSAPLFEELFFRGAMYRNLRVGLGRAGPLGSALLSIGISSVVFAAIHPQGLIFIPVLGGLAVAFCLMREWRGSINASIVAHALNNFTVLSLNVLMLRSEIQAG